MEINLQERFERIQTRIEKISINELILSRDEQTEHSVKVQNIIAEEVADLSPAHAQRLRNEYAGWGPIEDLLIREDITEILINGPYSIWFEVSGKLQHHEDHFFSLITFRNTLERMAREASVQINIENPCADGRFRDFRLSMIGHELTQNQTHVSLRRHPRNPWNFQRLQEQGWCQPQDLLLLKNLLTQRKNFLIVGATGAGKTSVLNSFLAEIPHDERILAIEDTSEIVLPNTGSMKLLTREDANGILPTVDQAQLVKRALRLRPDRIAMGEVRGSEAKDFLMALATGHSGSFGTLHAKDAHQALIRLEMLIQMGAAQWSLQAVRRLMQLSLDYIIVTGKNKKGERFFQGAYKISSLEDHGFILEKIEACQEQRL